VRLLGQQQPEGGQQQLVAPVGGQAGHGNHHGGAAQLELLADGRRIYLLGEGRLINLAAAEGHPASVMDMSFANQSLASEYAVKHRGRLEKKVYRVPHAIDAEIARLKLESMGVKIDTLTEEQRKYLESWEMGT